MADEFRKAAKLRAVIQRIVRAEISRIVPPPRVGQVQHIDRLNNKISVVFPGDDTPLEVNMTPGNQPQASLYDVPEGNAPADLVRIGGRPGNYYLMDVISSSARNLMYDEEIGNVAEELENIGTIGPFPAPTVSPVPEIMPGYGSAVVTWPSDPNHVYDVHVSELDTVPRTPATIHPEGHGVKPPLWIRNLPNGGPLPTTVDESGNTVPVPVYYAVQARTGRGAAPASDWVEGVAGKMDPAYLLLTVSSLIADGLFAEAASLVDLYVRGDFEANTISAIGQVSMRADNNELAQGARLFLRKGTSAPASPPGTVQDVPAVSVVNYATMEYSGGWVDGGNMYVMGQTQQDDPYAFIYRVPLAGGQAVPVGPLTTIGGSSLVKIGTLWYVQTFDSSTANVQVHIWDENFTALQSTWTLGAASTYARTVMTTDGTNLIFVYRNTPSGALHIIKKTPSGGAVGSAMNTGITPGTYDYPRGIVVGSQTGAPRIIVAMATLGSSWKSFFHVFSENAGVITRHANEEWESVSTRLSGFAWDGANFVHLDLPNKKLYTYSNDTWTTDNLWRFVSTTWYRDDGPETDQGPRSYFAPLKRRRTKVTTTAVPGTSDGFRAYMGPVPQATANATTDVITTDSPHGLVSGQTITFPVAVAPLKTTVTYFVRDVTSTTFKVATTSGGTAVNITTTGTVIYDPGRAKMWRVIQSTVPESYIVDPPVLGTPTPNPPATNTYGVGSLAQILTDDGLYFIDAEGAAELKSLKVGGNKLGYKRATQTVDFDASGDGIVTHNLGVVPAAVQVTLASHEGQTNQIIAPQSDWTATTIKIRLRSSTATIPNVSRTVSWTVFE